jgi:hypothetical protein
LSEVSSVFPLNQAIHPPFEDFALVEAHHRLMQNVAIWSDVGILVDEENKATLILLLQDGNVVAILRFCLSVEESIKAIQLFKKPSGMVFFGAWQGNMLTAEMIRSIEQISQIWGNIQAQVVEYLADDVRNYFQRIEDGSIKSGRNAPFSTPTKRAVMLASHGRCMFGGCGENLGFDQLTGTEGNFSYLAHNIASAENGPRGVIGLSDKLSDDHNNILLLCDKHHRLIDKIAAADYPAERLSRMRREFCETVERLLGGLCYQPIPAYAVLWPFNKQAIAPPSPVQIAQSLSKIQARLEQQLHIVTENDETIRNATPEILSILLPNIIGQAAEAIRMQAGGHKQRAALFALGLMPSLIALGAKLGNKNEIIPMLRYRDGGQWTWPSDMPRGRTYKIIGLEDLNNNESEITLIIALTADSEISNTVANELAEAKAIKSIKILADSQFIGNGAIAHPKDGMDFMADVQALLHRLVDKHGVSRVHVLPCASNAACVFFGQAYDKHHPELLVYDFVSGSMKPQIRIRNDNGMCSLSTGE